uniref:Tick transposon n=1 Tax=Rhipicephalus zambeziensis TaxID=60191 RepID=A0A224Z9U5_9ACAR
MYSVMVYASGPVLLQFLSIFLASVDRSLDYVFNDSNVLKVFRYVDDFIVFLTVTTDYRVTVNGILNDFKQHGQGLVFTHELPENNILQALDLRLEVCDRHVCWAYSPRAKKELVSFQSAHSKVVKRGIVSSCMESALKKSCEHKMQESFDNQVSRLSAAGYPMSLLTAVAESLIQKRKTSKRATCEREPFRPVVMPYLHKVTHQLKKVACRHDVPLVFSAPNKLSKLCSRTCGGSKHGCQIKHGVCYVPCSTCVVYAIPLSCGKTYIGQTGRCINERLREHAQKVNNNVDKGAHLVAHLNSCYRCAPRFRETMILGRSNNEHARLALEAYHIKKRSADCISDTSIYLYPSEYEFMRAHLR